MNKTYTFYSKKTEETVKLAKILADQLSEGNIICLNGDLGVGKTVFAQGLISSLGVKDYISSPTFTILNQYDAKYRIYHIDAYRLKNIDEVYDIGIDECILSDGISIIEWSNNIKEIIPENKLEIVINKSLDKGDNYREILLKPYGSSYKNIVDITYKRWLE